MSRNTTPRGSPSYTSTPRYLSPEGSVLPSILRSSNNTRINQRPRIRRVFFGNMADQQEVQQNGQREVIPQGSVNQPNGEGHQPNGERSGDETEPEDRRERDPLDLSEEVVERNVHMINEHDRVKYLIAGWRHIGCPWSFVEEYYNAFIVLGRQKAMHNNVTSLENALRAKLRDYHVDLDDMTRFDAALDSIQFRDRRRLEDSIELEQDDISQERPIARNIMREATQPSTSAGMTSGPSGTTAKAPPRPTRPRMSYGARVHQEEEQLEDDSVTTYQGRVNGAVNAPFTSSILTQPSLYLRDLPRRRRLRLAGNSRESTERRGDHKRSGNSIQQVAGPQVATIEENISKVVYERESPADADLQTSTRGIRCDLILQGM